MCAVPRSCFARRIRTKKKKIGLIILWCFIRIFPFFFFFRLAHRPETDRVVRDRHPDHRDRVQQLGARGLAAGHGLSTASPAAAPPPPSPLRLGGRCPRRRPSPAAADGVQRLRQHDRRLRGRLRGFRPVLRAADVRPASAVHR